jgi:L-lactate dehydrogenase complex protein LldG
VSARDARPGENAPRSSRRDILAAVRAAVGSAPEPPVATVPRRSPDATVDLVGLFVERVADYRAVVERCSPHELGERVAAALSDGSRVVVPDGLDLDVPGAVADRDLSAADLDGLDAVVTRARLGVAETGTIVLDHGPGQGRRAITLVPDHHVCIIDAAQVVADVPDAFDVLDTARPLTWISGPSATSDIELERVEGVHGPRRLHVIVVG